MATPQEFSVAAVAAVVSEPESLFSLKKIFFFLDWPWQEIDVQVAPLVAAPASC